MPRSKSRKSKKSRKKSKTLPQFSGKLHLSKFGYSIHKADSTRQKSLRDASNHYGSLETLRHLNLARNYQSIEKNKDIMGNDVKYMSKLHARRKSRKGSRRKSRRSKRKGSRRKSRRSKK
jgi:hypothetical protein